MKKGTSIVHLIRVIQELEDSGIERNDPTFEARASSAYRNIFKVQSETTKISNAREFAVVEFQDRLPIIKVPQDGNGIDFITAELVGDTVKIQAIQQKGNTGSLNASSAKAAKQDLKDFIEEDKIPLYFDFLEDDLNPNKTGYGYEVVEIFFGYYLGVGNGKVGEFTSYGGNNYLRKLGITKDLVDLELWVCDYLLDEDNFQVNATNFNEIFHKLITQ